MGKRSFRRSWGESSPCAEADLVATTSGAIQLPKTIAMIKYLVCSVIKTDCDAFNRHEHQYHRGGLCCVPEIPNKSYLIAHSENSAWPTCIDASRPRTNLGPINQRRLGCRCAAANEPRESSTADRVASNWLGIWRSRGDGRLSSSGSGSAALAPTSPVCRARTRSGAPGSRI